MKIKMLKTEKGSTDGLKVGTYEQGQEYDLSSTSGERELAAAFIGARMAEHVVDEPTAPVVIAEEKAAPAPEENKAMAAAPENKAGPDLQFKKSGKRKG